MDINRIEQLIYESETARKNNILASLLIIMPSPLIFIILEYDNENQISPMTIVCGKRCTGTTTLLCDLLRNSRKQFDKIIAVYPAASIDNAYQNLTENVFEEMNQEVMDKTVMHQLYLYQRFGRCPLFKILMIFDKYDHENQNIIKILMKLNNKLNITLWMACDSLIDISMLIRFLPSCIQSLFILREESFFRKHYLYDIYKQFYPLSNETFKEFDDIFQEYTRNYGAFHLQCLTGQKSCYRAIL